MLPALVAPLMTSFFCIATLFTYPIGVAMAVFASLNDNRLIPRNGDCILAIWIAHLVVTGM